LSSAAEKVGVQTGLDALGVIPGEGNVLGAVQLAAGVVSGGISAYNNEMTGAGLATGGLVLAAAGDSGIRLAVNGVKVIPILGNLVSLGAVAVDVFGPDGGVAAYQSCMNGTN
jgi:hypothetical protein